MTVCDGAAGKVAMRRLVDRLAPPELQKDAASKQDGITIDVIDLKLPNALALPGDHVLVTSGLIELATSPDMVSAVVAHEIAHLDLRHPTQSAISNLGISATVSIILGGSSVGTWRRCLINGDRIQKGKAMKIRVIGVVPPCPRCQRMYDLAHEVAQELGIRYLIEGSVQRQGDQLRINAQLIDAVGGQHLWADRYSGTMNDVFALQDKVLGEIVAALQLELPDTTGRSETSNPAAYDALLQGRERLRQGSETETLAAIEAFERAVALDPEYARAHARLAAAHEKAPSGDQAISRSEAGALPSMFVIGRRQPA